MTNQLLLYQGSKSYQESLKKIQDVCKLHKTHIHLLKHYFHPKQIHLDIH